MQNSSTRLILWFYSEVRSEYNKFPDFVKQRKNDNWFIESLSIIEKTSLERNLVKIEFKNKQEELIMIVESLWIIHHGLKNIPKEEIEIPYLKLHYSASDPDYDERWAKISLTKNWQELELLLEEWILSHKIDPLRRIKHRGLNLFGPLDTDLQYFNELWRLEKNEEALNLLQEFKEEWYKEKTLPKSPFFLLLRLWYMIFGKSSVWKEIGYPEPFDVSLPEDKSLYDWLKYFHGENIALTEWDHLLECVGIKKLQDNFTANRDSNIYIFCKLLECIVKHNKLADVLIKSKSSPIDSLWKLSDSYNEVSLISEMCYERGYFIMSLRRKIEEFIEDINTNTRDSEIYKKPENLFNGWLNNLSNAFENLKHQVLKSGKSE